MQFPCVVLDPITRLTFMNHCFSCYSLLKFSLFSVACELWKTSKFKAQHILILPCLTLILILHSLLTNDESCIPARLRPSSLLGLVICISTLRSKVWGNISQLLRLRFYIKGTEGISRSSLYLIKGGKINLKKLYMCFIFLLILFWQSVNKT